MKKLTSLIVFSIAFGLVEASVVVYLRRIMGIDQQLYQIPNPKFILNLGFIAFLEKNTKFFLDPMLLRLETLREAATILMLSAVSFMVGEGTKQKFGAFLIAFSIWDIFYYVFLYLFIGWPTSVWNIDVFFLIPTAWVGPVITALVASLTMLIVGLYLFLPTSTMGNKK